MKVETIKVKRRARSDSWLPHVEQLRVQAKAGVSAGQIAKHSLDLFGRKFTRSAVCGAGKRFGIKFGDGRGDPDMLERKRVKAVAKKKPFKKPPTPVAAIMRTDVADEPPPRGPMNDVVDSGRCRWIHGDPARPPWQMCGHVTLEGRSYCGHHTVRSYQKNTRHGEYKGQSAKIIPLRRPT